MLEQFLAGLDVLRRDLAGVPAHSLAVMHMYDRGGARWSDLLAGTGDRTIHLFTTVEPARRERAMASVPIGRDAPAPAGSGPRS